MLKPDDHQNHVSLPISVEPELIQELPRRVSVLFGPVSIILSMVAVTVAIVLLVRAFPDGIMMLFAWIAVCVFAVFYFARRWHLVRCGTAAIAEVEQIEIIEGSEGDKALSVQFSYARDGAKSRGEFITGTGDTVKAGDKFTVIYDPLDPKCKPVRYSKCFFKASLPRRAPPITKS